MALANLLTKGTQQEGADQENPKKTMAAAEDSMAFLVSFPRPTDQ
jgi:hypothetical protein